VLKLWSNKLHDVSSVVKYSHKGCVWHGSLTYHSQTLALYNNSIGIGKLCSDIFSLMMT